MAAEKQRALKKAKVSQIEEKLKAAQVSVLTDYRGLTVAEMDELRKQLRESKVEFRVLKNTLTRLAAKETGLDDLRPFLEGPTAIAFGIDDPVTPAKILFDFAKTHKALEVKAGVLEGDIISMERVRDLAELPSREQLLTQVAVAMQAPIAGLVTVLQGPIRGLAVAMDALRRQREQEA